MSQAYDSGLVRKIQLMLEIPEDAPIPKVLEEAVKRHMRMIRLLDGRITVAAIAFLCELHWDEIGPQLPVLRGEVEEEPKPKRGRPKKVEA